MIHQIFLSSKFPVVRYSHYINATSQSCGSFTSLPIHYGVLLNCNSLPYTYIQVYIIALYTNVLCIVSHVLLVHVFYCHWRQVSPVMIAINSS